MRGARADFDFTYELFEQRTVSLCLDLHIPVIKVLHVSTQSKGLCLARNKPAETHSLDKSLNDDVEIRFHGGDVRR